MKIHKALKVKNRLTGELKRLQDILQRENSRRNDNTSKVDCGELDIQIQTTTDKLVRIKAALAQANGPIAEKIYRLSEIKNRINFLNSLPTKEGEEVTLVGHNREKLVYNWTTYLNREAVDKKIVELQQIANTLQDEIDSFNASTEVEYLD